MELSTKVTAEAVVALEPAFVIAATGAPPYVVDLPLLGVEVMQAWALLAGEVPAVATGRRRGLGEATPPGLMQPSFSRRRATPRRSRSPR